MKRIACTAFSVGLAVCLAHGQNTTVPTDVLGAHLNYGRGCAACHAPHSGAQGNGRTGNPGVESGMVALWGEDITGLYGRTLRSGGGKFVETLPDSMEANTPDVEGLLECLSCHDGNFASRAMMRNRVYEKLPPTYGTFNTIPTLLGEGGMLNGNYFSQHPVGLSAVIDCARLGWDCSQKEGVISMKGPRSSEFVRNYGLFIKPGKYNNTAVVMCNTCHDPHLMNTIAVDKGTRSGLPAGHYATMFFLRGPYNPASTTPGNNQAAQFCRQCHGQESNEMNGGSTIATVF